MIRPSFCLPGLAIAIGIWITLGINGIVSELMVHRSITVAGLNDMSWRIAALAAWIVIWRLQRAAKRIDERVPVCAQCSYMLKGLSEPRCPECGRVYTLDEFHRL
ncbi:MAG: hypothetical protein HYR83_12180 [Planctomycetes bacterium]|nr:hypothetical protein [Planctomycetota bacterium]